MRTVSPEHLAKIAELQNRQTNVAQRLGVIVREAVKMSTLAGQGPEADARVGAYVLQQWPQARKLLEEHDELLAQQQRAGWFALSSVDLNPDDPDETYRIEENGRVVKLGQENGQAAWVEA